MTMQLLWTKRSLVQELQANSNVVIAYKKYNESLEINCTENQGDDTNVNLMITDFKGSNSDLGAPDFDVIG